MTIATNLLVIMLAINLMIFVFGSPENNSPMLGVVKGIVMGNFWQVLESIGTSAWIYGILIGLIAGVAFLTGAFPGTGGGYAALLVLQVLAIAIFSAVLLFPNFSTFGFPAMIEYILDVIFGGFTVITVVSLLRGF